MFVKLSNGQLLQGDGSIEFSAPLEASEQLWTVFRYQFKWKL